MPRKDIYHQTVIEALTQDDWIITNDPLHLSYGGRNLYVDLGAEADIMAAEKSGRKIAVEIKSFLGESDVHDFELSIGQYRLYRNILNEIEPERKLFLAVPIYSYEGIFSEPIGRLVIRKEDLKIIVFDTKYNRIKEWIQ